MKTKRTLPTDDNRWMAIVLGFLSLSLVISGCNPSGRPSSGQPGGVQAGIASYTPSPTITPFPTATPTPWPTFVPALETWPTPAPPPAARAELPEGTTVWLLLGAEEALPTHGRTQAIHLVLVNERLSKASLISIPGSTFLYLPGQGMGRINTAWPLGGMKLIYDTLGYNFGLRPDRYVVAHDTEFSWLVDDLDGLEVSVLYPIRDDCGGLPAGLHSMDGQKTLCYVSYYGDDDVYRTTRQQQVLQLLFTKLVQWGRLARLPVMYLSYDQNLDTDISLLDLIWRIPLALRLGDPERLKTFVLGWESLEQWQLPDHTQAEVLLPREGKISQLVSQAIEAISNPSALNAVVLTYEFQLTQAIGMTQTVDAQLTKVSFPTNTPTPPVLVAPTATAAGPWTSTPVATRQTPTATWRPTNTPAPSPTRSDPYPFPTAIWDTPTAYP
ncbi:MAG: LCP family protein [Anaerolineaceae bacterium]|nr:LCP family protein [Anaerolineaceae bacterium]